MKDTNAEVIVQQVRRRIEEMTKKSRYDFSDPKYPIKLFEDDEKTLIAVDKDHVMVQHKVPVVHTVYDFDVVNDKEVKQ